MCLGQENKYFLLKKAKKSAQLQRQKVVKKEEMKENDINTCLQQGPMSLPNPQHMCLSQENKCFLLKKAKKSAQLQRKKWSKRGNGRE